MSFTPPRQRPIGRQLIATALVLAGFIAAALLLPVERAQLLLEYLRVLAWPAVVLLAALLFRERLAGLLSRLRRAEVPGGRLEFNKEFLSRIERVAEDTQEAVADVERVAEAALPAAAPKAASVKALEDFAHSLRSLRDTRGGPTYSQLADSTGYSARAIADAFSGRRLPTWELTYALATALDGTSQVEEWRQKWKKVSVLRSYRGRS